MGQADREAAALTPDAGAGQAHGAAVLLGEPFDEGEAQPAAFVLPRELRVELDEGLEEPGLVGGGNAGAIVLHGKVDTPRRGV